MNKELIKPKLVEKEQIESLVFPQEEIKRTKEEKEALIRKLNDAMTLGNLHHSKIKIIFEDSEGLKEVDTTIWAAGEDFITLKKGVSIPVKRIVSVEL